jgi:hypothetical protein
VNALGLIWFDLPPRRAGFSVGLFGNYSSPYKVSSSNLCGDNACLACGSMTLFPQEQLLQLGVGNLCEHVVFSCDEGSRQVV